MTPPAFRFSFILVFLFAVAVMACNDEGNPPADSGVMPDQAPGTDGQKDGPLITDGKSTGDKKTPVPDKMAPDTKKVPAHWVKVGGTVQPMVYGHTATKLNNGQVLGAGGDSYSLTTTKDTVHDQCFLYLPTQNKFMQTGKLNVARAYHTATLLKSGKVLVTGGTSPSTYEKSTEIFDPATGKWTKGKDMFKHRWDHAAVRMQDAKNMVLVTGGFYSSDSTNSVIIYDPTSDTWASPSSSLTEIRRGHTMTMLKTGDVLVAGGVKGKNISTYDSLDTLELFKANGTVLPIAAKMHWKRNGHTATLLQSGKVLIVGGICWKGCTGTKVNDIYDPMKNSVTSLGYPGTPPTGHAAAPLKDGRVLVAGNSSYKSDSKMAVTYDPQGGLTAWKQEPNMHYGRRGPQAVTLDSGKVLLVGGDTDPGIYPDAAEVYHP